MSTITAALPRAERYPVELTVDPQTEARNRLTTAFRLVLALPHLLLVGGPLAAGLTWSYRTDSPFHLDTTVSGGALGAVAMLMAIISWFAILFTSRHPRGLWNFAAFFLRWRVRAISYSALLRDEYPPFGEDDGSFPARLHLDPPAMPRDRVTVAFRLFLAIPHVLIVWALTLAWAVTTTIAWFSILFTGRYPDGLYHFALNVFRWNIRVEAYLLLLRDEYPPFSFSA